MPGCTLEGTSVVSLEVVLGALRANPLFVRPCRLLVPRLELVGSDVLRLPDFTRLGEGAFPAFALHCPRLGPES